MVDKLVVSSCVPGDFITVYSPLVFDCLLRRVANLLPPCFGVCLLTGTDGMLKGGTACDCLCAVFVFAMLVLNRNLVFTGQMGEELKGRVDWGFFSYYGAGC